MIDQEKIKEGVRLLLEGIGEDPSREGLIETPDRIARMYTELFSGMEEAPSTHLSKMFHTDNTEMVLEKDITFYSTCEHHMLPFFGKVHIAYVPDGKVVGLSRSLIHISEPTRPRQKSYAVICLKKKTDVRARIHNRSDGFEQISENDLKVH